MVRFLKILAKTEDVLSPNGSALGRLGVPMLIPLTSLVSATVVASRDPQDRAVVKGLALILSVTGAASVPVAILTDTDDPQLLADFAIHVDGILAAIGGTGELVEIEPMTF